MDYVNEIEFHNKNNKISSLYPFLPVVRWFVYVLLKVLNIRTKSFVFVATTGRSGTQSLAAAVNELDGAQSHHEPFPIMYTPEAFQTTSASTKTQYFKRLFELKKRLYIRKSSVGVKTYLETNHLFIKNFSNFVIKEFGSKLKVIHLVREPQKVAQSFFEINSIPGSTKWGKAWLIDPRSENNLINIDYSHLANDEMEQNFLHCLWYWYETQARFLAFSQQHPNVPVFTIKTPELNDPDRIKLLNQFLGYSANLVEAQIGKRKNLKKGRKKSLLAQERYEQLSTEMDALFRANVPSKFLYQI